MGYVGKHRPPTPEPQPWEEAVGVGQDYGPQTGTGFKKGFDRLAKAGHEQQPETIDQKYRGFKASFNQLFPEVERLAQGTKKLIGRLAVWRAGKQAMEQQQMQLAHQALQHVEAEVTQQHQILPPPPDLPRHEPTPVDELAQQASKASMDALTAPTMYLPRHANKGPNQHPDHKDGEDLVSAAK
ncbi:MAG TPA: hypothetical protein VFT87_04800 [Candidatus Saccharimonadales bacterium]|nr:hypothetical protein [Candidatus Saccharimonadales bacterium]